MDFELMSKSELVALCHNNGVMQAHRGMQRELLIDLLIGLENERAFDNPLTQVRKAAASFLRRYKPMVSTMPCDVNCPKCSMALTVGCYADNKEHFNLETSQ